MKKTIFFFVLTSFTICPIIKAQQPVPAAAAPAVPAAPAAKNPDTEKYVPSPYKFFVGSNFDLVDGVKATNVYSAIDIRIDTVFRPFKKYDSRKSGIKTLLDIAGNLGMNLGIEELKAFSLVSSSHDTLLQYYDLGSISTKARTIRELNNRSFYSTQVTNRTVSFYVDPTLSIDKKGIFNIIWHNELFYSSQVTSFTYQTSHIDTFLVHYDSSQSYASQQAKLPGSITSQNVYGETGIGFMVHYADQYIDLCFKAAYSSAYFNSPYKHDWFLQVYVIENKYSGISFGGEIRWFEDAFVDTRPNHYTLPVYSLNLSKTLSLKKLGSIFLKE
jgi:hypothetical protein